MSVEALRLRWISSGALVLSLHGAALAVLATISTNSVLPPLPEPVVLVELAPLAAPMATNDQNAAEAEPVPEPFHTSPATPPLSLSAPLVNAPLPREVVAAQIAAKEPEQAPTSISPQPSPRAAGPQGMGDPGSPGDDPSSLQQEADYRSLVRAYVARNRFSPPQSRREGFSGDIGLRFVVNRHGDISQVTVSRSSGHELLDSEAVDFVRRLSNVPAFPRDLRRSDIPLSITLRFSLDRR